MATAPTKKWTRKELEKTVDIWLAANKQAEKTGDWRCLADVYTKDCYYAWDIPGGLYEARGRENIRATCVGDAMDPYAGWSYPYEKIVIDEKKGEVFCWWWQVPPGKLKNKDGSPMRVIGASWFKYGGNYQWKEQRDFYDFQKTMEFIDQCADKGALSDLAMERRYERNLMMIKMCEARLAYLKKSVKKKPASLVAKEKAAAKAAKEAAKKKSAKKPAAKNPAVKKPVAKKPAAKKK
jgi:hypothetical protein